MSRHLIENNTCIQFSNAVDDGEHYIIFEEGTQRKVEGNELTIKTSIRE